MYILNNTIKLPVMAGIAAFAISYNADGDMSVRDAVDGHLDVYPGDTVVQVDGPQEEGFSVWAKAGFPQSPGSYEDDLITVAVCHLDQAAEEDLLDVSDIV